jgi:hypothetical protein
MIVALLVMFITSLLIAAVFVSTNGDIKLTRTDTSQKQAYYAAQAGISRYKYQLNTEPNSWLTCPSYEHTVPGASEEKYAVKTLPSSSWEAKGRTTCESGKQSSIVQSSGSANGTFRIESTGESGGVKRSIVATLTHPGYLNYVYFSNFEEADPETTGKSESECEYYRAEREAKHLTASCVSFPWIPDDKIEGPFHTNDTAEMYGSPVFGRSGHEPPDHLEFDRGHVGGTSKFEGEYSEGGATLLPPEVPAEELLTEASDKFTGRTIITLEGTQMTVTRQGEGKSAEVLPFPSNGVIAILNSAEGCPVKYKALETKYNMEDLKCGNVYIKGHYTESLTVISQNDIIVAGNLTTEGGESGGEPTGAATLGLIAIEHARLYHPIKECETTVKHEAEAEAEVTGGSTVLKNVSPASAITEGAEISGTKIKAGTKVTSTANLASKGEITISKAVEGSGSSKEKIKVKTEVKEVVECKNTEDTCPNSANAAVGEKPTEEFGGPLDNPVIDAAILSTKHSWGVDNFSCGGELGDITIWGSIAENFRGRVTCCLNSTPTEGDYIKNYKYDERLATDEPPSFLSPSTTSGWKISRETAPPIGFTG